MSHLTQNLIKAYQQSKPVHLRALTGTEFKKLIHELSLARKGESYDR